MSAPRRGIVVLGLLATAACVVDRPIADEARESELLQALRDRAAYQRLDRPAVERLAIAAERRWRSAFKALDRSRVERFSAGGESHWMSIWIHRATGLEFALVPGGRFLMGSPPSEAGRDDDEAQSSMDVDPFLIARTECTGSSWARLAEQAGLDPEPSYFGGSPEHPVEQVSADEVDAWCGVAGLQLPTEVQREYACRAGTTSAFAYGEALEASQALTDHGFDDGPLAVGSLAPNAFGLFDMHGNIWEWCRDHVSPLSTGRVLRGGSYFNGARWARSADRSQYAAAESSRLTGFRPSLDLAD